MCIVLLAASELKYRCNKDIIPEMLLAVFMGFCVYWIKYLQVHLAIVLIAQVVLGAIIYIGFSALFKLEAYIYIVDAFKHYINNHYK